MSESNTVWFHFVSSAVLIISLVQRHKGLSILFSRYQVDPFSPNSRAPVLPMNTYVIT